MESWPHHNPKTEAEVAHKLARFDLPRPEGEYEFRDHAFLEQVLLLFSQKDPARWGNEDRTDQERERMQESLGEHVGGLNMVARLVKERAKEEEDRDILSLDWEKIDRIIQVHDLAEAIFGDKVHKDSVLEEQEDQAMQIMIERGEKLGMGSWLQEVLDEYWEKDSEGRKTSLEANFVKTLDEIEGVMHMFHARRLDKNKRGYQNHVEFFDLYTRDFPTLKKTALYMINLWDDYKEDPAWAHDTAKQTDMLETLDESLKEKTS